MIDKLPEHISAIYIDTNIYIYLVEGEANFRSSSKALLQELIRREIQYISSSLAHAECLHGVYKKNLVSLVPIYKDLFHGIHAPQLVELAHAVFQRAAEYAAIFSMKLIDAVHVASAVMSRCDHFLTNDRGIRGPSSLQIVQLSDILQRET